MGLGTIQGNTAVQHEYERDPRGKSVGVRQKHILHRQLANRELLAARSLEKGTVPVSREQEKAQHAILNRKLD